MVDVTDLATSQTEVRRRVAGITAEQWDLPTPCSEWNVKDLVVHMVEGSRMSLLLLQGATAEESLAVFGAAHGAYIAAELEVALAEELAAFAQPGALETIVHHPAPGDIPGATMLQFRTGDYLLHGWDLATATGGDEAMDEDLVLITWEAMQPMVPFIAEIGIFGTGPSGTVTEDAPLHLRLLDLTGRRPS